MAAIAGSKGCITGTRKDDGLGLPAPLHAHVADEILTGAISPTEGADLLTSQRRLREVGIDTNMICNLKCAYCYLDDRPESKAQFSGETWHSMIDPLIDLGTKLVAVIGKEPLGDGVALDFLTRLGNTRTADRSFRTGMVTNGTLLDRHLEKVLQAGLGYLDVSMDGLGQVNDQMRGDGAGARALANVQRLCQESFTFDFAITSVLHAQNKHAYGDFVSEIMGLQKANLFVSPVLKFTNNERIENWAIASHDLYEFIERMADRLSRDAAGWQRQVIIDLPYTYSWGMLRDRFFEAKDVKEDCYEAHFVQPDPTVPLFIKLNFLSLSYWRAVRVTHDGTMVENMDLAAHPAYDIVSPKLDDWESSWVYGGPDDKGRAFLESFLGFHSAPANLDSLFDRNIPGQLRHSLAWSRGLAAQQGQAIAI